MSTLGITYYNKFSLQNSYYFKHIKCKYVHFLLLYNYINYKLRIYIHENNKNFLLSFAIYIL